MTKEQIREFLLSLTVPEFNEFIRFIQREYQDKFYQDLKEKRRPYLDKRCKELEDQYGAVSYCREFNDAFGEFVLHARDCHYYPETAVSGSCKDFRKA